MSNQNTQTFNSAFGAFIERIADQIGVLFLLGIGLSTAGATLLVGM